MDIKYRAWIKRERKYIHIVGFCYEDETGIRLWYYSQSIDEEMFLFNESYNKNEVVLEQYIGMEDINFKKIYQGDLLKCEYTLYRSIAIGEVKQIAGCWNVDFKYNSPENRPWCGDVQMRRNQDYVKMFLPVIHNKMEIIGNINEGINKVYKNEAKL